MLAYPTTTIANFSTSALSCHSCAHAHPVSARTCSINSESKCYHRRGIKSPASSNIQGLHSCAQAYQALFSTVSGLNDQVFLSTYHQQLIYVELNRIQVPTNASLPYFIATIV